LDILIRLAVGPMQFDQSKRRDLVRLLVAAAATAWPFVACAQGQTSQPPPNGVSIERSAVFDLTPVTGTLKETVQKRQQLVWRARRSPNEGRFELTDMSVALLRNEATGEVKLTFAGHVSALGWRPERDPKLAVIIRTRGGASIYSWTVDFSVRCADTDRPLPPLSQMVPNDIAPNLFSSAGTVEISEYREPNVPILMVRQCPA
jgi:hypothetical protein